MNSRQSIASKSLWSISRPNGSEPPPIIFLHVHILYSVVLLTHVLQAQVVEAQRCEVRLPIQGVVYISKYHIVFLPINGLHCSIVLWNYVIIQAAMCEFYVSCPFAHQHERYKQSERTLSNRASQSRESSGYHVLSCLQDQFLQLIQSYYGRRIPCCPPCRPRVHHGRSRHLPMFRAF